MAPWNETYELYRLVSSLALQPRVKPEESQLDDDPTDQSCDRGNIHEPAKDNCCVICDIQIDQG